MVPLRSLDSTLGWGSTPNAFLFSLHDNEGLAPFKSMVRNPSYAMYSYPGYGQRFGDDIVINYNTRYWSTTMFGHSYSVPSGVHDRFTILAGVRYFTPDEVEVFYLYQ